MTGQGLRWQGGQCRGHGQGTRLGDHLSVENVGEGAFNAVINGTPAGGEILRQMGQGVDDLECNLLLC